MKNVLLILIFVTFLSSCGNKKEDNSSDVSKSFSWENANVYFLLTDRFNNGTTDNDVNFERTQKTGKLRGFKGGDIIGITKKIKEGYFNKLGVNAIWLTPITEQIHGAVNEGWGNTYGFHGYWTKDWTALDPNFGTMDDLREMVKTAHAHGIRILMDAVINHTGPVTEKDPVWDNDWVRTNPICTYKNFKTTAECTLTNNLPDIKTESNKEVDIPKALAEKWKAEGRYEQEMQELDAFFKRTGYPRTPRYYIIKWLCDYIVDFGIDGYRCDTVKHIEESVWDDFCKQCAIAFDKWKKENPSKVLDDTPFYLVGEVYGYGIDGGLYYDFGDKKVDYFANGFKALLNFGFKYDAQKSYEELFAKYSTILHTTLKGYSVLNYLTSHDDGSPFDSTREKGYEAGTKLLLAPGAAQIYYGDESNRPLIIAGTEGDATLRSMMNWDSEKSDPKVKQLLKHWQKLGQFRNDHVAVGAGLHKMISEKPYVFTRTYKKGDVSDKVYVALDVNKGRKELPVTGLADGTKLNDAYSGKSAEVKNGKVVFDTPFDIVLMELAINN